ncbi:MAG TPA: DUF4383 domain-containing protein [Candidatus Limnocylindrales bacterium]|jgi:hypothetical protein|nr:DUF4383 domain-containing protein [Candidatus Limnocylindrales bacterium]
MRDYRIGNYGLAQAYAAVIGIVLVIVGLLGFISNPIVGEEDAIFVTGAVHNIVHLVTGALALYIAFGLSGEAQANGVIGLGVLYALLFVLLLLSPSLFGILQYNVNAADHALHAVLAVLSLAVGYLARGSASPVAAR